MFEEGKYVEDKKVEEEVKEIEYMQTLGKFTKPKGIDV